MARIDYNYRKLPRKVFLDGAPYLGPALFINGYNGHETSPHDSLLAAIIDNCCSKAGHYNYLTDEDGNQIHSTNRRGNRITFKA